MLTMLWDNVIIIIIIIIIIISKSYVLHEYDDGSRALFAHIIVDTLYYIKRLVTILAVGDHHSYQFVLIARTTKIIITNLFI